MEINDDRVEIRILFFGAIAEVIGSRTSSHSVITKTTSTQVLAQMIERFPQLSHQKLLLSVNQQYATGNEIICDGDELAIFTAVSGG